MNNDPSRYEEAALIRSHYKEAIEATYKIYYDSEEIAAYIVLELFRLENLKCSSETEEKDRLERLSEKSEILSHTKMTMRFILDRLHELARDRDKYIADIYTSARIVDLETRLSDLTPWLTDLLIEVQTRAEAARSSARITSEIARAKNAY